MKKIDDGTKALGKIDIPSELKYLKENVKLLEKEYNRITELFEAAPYSVMDKAYKPVLSSLMLDIQNKIVKTNLEIERLSYAIKHDN